MPNPATIFGSLKTHHMSVMPRIPMPTTESPMTPPLEKATRSP